MIRSFFGILFSFLIFFSCSQQPADINIGVYLSLTGTTDLYGISANNGFDMALEEINSAGGLLGKKVNFIVIDDSSRSYYALKAVEKLIIEHKVVAILGEVVSSRSLAAAPYCQDKEIPMVTPSSTHPEVTNIGDFIFRTCFIDPFQGEIMASFCYERLKIKKVAMLLDLKNEYSMNLGRFFNDKFGNLGGRICVTEFYSEGDKEFASQIRKIKLNLPQAIFMPGYFNEVGLFAIQARKAGIKVPIVGTDGWSSPHLLEIAGKELEGGYFSDHFATETESPLVENFVNKYSNKYNLVPDANAALAYDAAMVLFNAIKRAGKAEPFLIRDALAATIDFPGIVGPITIDENRNAVKPAVIMKITNNDLKYVDSVKP